MPDVFNKKWLNEEINLHYSCNTLFLSYYYIYK